ncbi:phosphonoacetaldehyde hydrolase [Candidatus Stoquefichus massiliensis]|uniref:phosphonoacetaldehyde hydrolase n=1 Tax=Candidatus Stoquefichus massiliensis TaxID=1470350 RepID=UPI000488DFDE|nr:phosphonoacetaldehyde hydrolase [Candidatus Stoquefichus massiliensis]
MKIEAVIFDWAGTTVDYGCFAPVQAFHDAFEAYGLHPTFDEIRQPMGMLKIDHIKTMLEMDSLEKEFQDVYQRSYTDEDVHHIYDIFEKTLMEGITQHTRIKPYVVETVQKLRIKGLKIGSTTGYTDMMMEPVLKSAKEQGYEPDCWYSPDATEHFGRPYPYMIFKNMMTLNITSVHHVIKVGDTVSDIQEAVNAGVYAIGVIEGSSLLGYSEHEYKCLDLNEKMRAIARVKKTYFNHGADAVIMNFSELPQLIERLLLEEDH